jgi:bacterioferritin-associated ferredoxin
MAIVCHCFAVRDRTIQRAIRNGAATLDDVRAECRATSRCGGCEPAVLDMLADAEPAYESIVAVAIAV